MTDQPGQDGTATSDKPAPVDGLSIAAMALGIASLVLFWLPIVNLILAILAVIFGIIGITRKISVGMAVAGVSTGAITLILILIFFITALAQHSGR